MKAFLITMIVLLMIAVSRTLANEDREDPWCAIGVLILQGSLVAWAFYLLVSL